MKSINPATGELIQHYDPHSDAEVEQRVQRAETAFDEYRQTSFTQRSQWLNRIADILDSESERIATLMTTEMGKPIAAARSEAAKCAWVCRYYAEHAERHLTDEPIPTEARDSRCVYQPLGPILAVMPWNFPFWQLFRFAAPAVAAGNVVLLKHAPNVSGCALEIEQLFSRAGFPHSTVQSLLIEPTRVDAIIADPRVKGVTLTGSTKAGRAVASAAGANIKKSVLELGGSDPFIVMPSADIENAAESAITARMINNGQSCIAAKRFIVHRDVAGTFLDAFTDRLEAIRVGDPFDEDTELGPLATDAIRREVIEQVRRSVDAGARVIAGGEIPEHSANSGGYYYAPLALGEIPDGTPAANDEIFGPVASVFVVDSLDQAIERANRTDFGLGASVWTQVAGEADLLVREIESGSVFVNRIVASDPRLPFGGVKSSGYGRELGPHGIREFVNAKTVVRA